MTVRVLTMPGTSEERSDTELLEACAGGDRAALGALYRRHQDRIRRFASRMLGGNDAEDVVQATFVIAWEQSSRFRADATVLEWLIGICAHQVRRARRSERRRRIALLLLGLERPRSTGTELAGQDQLLRRRMRDALDALPHHLRTVFLLCEVEDLSGVEVARALGLPAGTVWRRLHQARARLRRALREEGP